MPRNTVACGGLPWVGAPVRLSCLAARTHSGDGGCGRIVAGARSVPSHPPEGGASMADEIRVPIAAAGDIVAARGEGRALAGRLGFSRTDATLIATAISEVGRNILVHAGSGEIVLRSAVEDVRAGVLVIARDKGPGIGDVDAALRDGYATKNGLGLGLPGSRRIMDEFRIDTHVGRGTTVEMRKWRLRDELERLRAARAARR
jgi:anti-sigma regulatory factor (Ser/Thr protein kinase)